MKKFSTIILNIIGSIAVISLFYYLIKGEFRVNTPLSANDNNVNIISNFEKIDREEKKLIYSIKRDQNLSSQSKSLHRLKSNMDKTVSYQDVKNRRERLVKDLFIKKETISTEYRRKSNFNDRNNTDEKIVKDDINSLSSIKAEINETKDKNETSKDNYYSPYVWDVNWPFNRDANKSDDTKGNLIDSQSIEEKIDEIGGEIGDKVLIRIFKEEMRLELWMSVTGEYKLIKSYSLESYTGVLGPKLSLGDTQAPEGYYSINSNGLIKEESDFIKIDVGFPNRYDTEHNISSGYASIHNSSIKEDGFILGDKNIAEMYEIIEAALLNGYKAIPVYIYPFVMSEDNMQKHSNSQWIDFWINIKEGYDYFNHYHRTPNIEIKNGKYTFHIL